MAAQTTDRTLQSHFTTLARALSDNEGKIMDELNKVQGRPVDIGGYYSPTPALRKKSQLGEVPSS